MGLYCGCVEDVSTKCRKEVVSLVNAELLKKEIKDLGIKQNTLAEKCGVTRQTIANWLDNPEAISVYHARVLADALRITEPDKIMAIFFASDVENTSTNR